MTTTLLPALCALPFLAAGLAAQRGVAEPRAGVAFAPPKSWGELPAGSDRGATVRLFAAPRGLARKTEGVHVPLLRVMWFAAGGDAGGDLVDGLPRTTPFRSLEDFARRGLGAADVAVEPRRAGGADGQRLIARGIDGDRQLFGQTVAVDGGQAALCIEVLAPHADKLRKDIDAALDSLTAVPRVPAAAAAPPWLADPEWASKDAAARAAARASWAAAIVAAASNQPETGYKVSKAKFWTVLSAADPAYTKKVVAAAEAARDWFARRFPELTRDPPLPAILRVFDSVDQFQALQLLRGDSREYDQLRRELYHVHDRDQGGPTGFGPVLRAVLWQICDDIDPAVLPAMPRWLDHGCWEFLRSSHFDGRKLEFTAGDVERGRIDYYRQKGLAIPSLWDLMQELIQPSPADGAMEALWGYTPECARLVRWLWLHDGQQAFDKPTLFADYVRALAQAHNQLGRDPTADVAPVGLSAAQEKERNSRYYRWRDALLVAINQHAVPLEVEAWKAINEKWIAWNRTFK